MLTMKRNREKERGRVSLSQISSILFCALLCALETVSLSTADPVLNQMKTVAERIVVFPDHQNPRSYYYVPSTLNLSQSYGKPQFFFYKYVYIKQDSSGTTQTAGGVLSLSIELSDERAALEQMMGGSYEYKVVPIDTMRSTLIYNAIGGEKQASPSMEAKSGTGADAGSGSSAIKEEGSESGGAAKPEKLAGREAPFTKKSFTIPLGKESASYLWKIFEEKKSLGLSIDCEFSYDGYELKEGKYEDATRTDRMSIPVMVSMEHNPDLFKVINLANKVSFTYRTLTILCFDFANEVNPDVMKKTVEVKIETAKGQKDSKTASFSKDSEPQQELSFNIPEKKGGTYQYRITRVFKDGRSEKGEWKEGNDAYLDLSEYEFLVTNN